jgi:hypothetical protein
MYSLTGGVLSKTKTFTALRPCFALAILLTATTARSVLRGSIPIVSFSVAVTGLRPEGYQWLKNGQPLVDDGGITGSATANFSITNSQPPAGGIGGVA